MPNPTLQGTGSSTHSITATTARVHRTAGPRGQPPTSAAPGTTRGHNRGTDSSVPSPSAGWVATQGLGKVVVSGVWLGVMGAWGLRILG